MRLFKWKFLDIRISLDFRSVLIQIHQNYNFGCENVLQNREKSSQNVLEKNPNNNLVFLLTTSNDIIKIIERTIDETMNQDRYNHQYQRDNRDQHQHDLLDYLHRCDRQYEQESHSYININNRSTDELV